MSDIYLQTERVALIPIDEKDGPLLFELNSDPEVMTYLLNENPTLEEADQSASRINERNKYYDLKLGIFKAVEKSTQEFMGWFILRPDKEDLDNKKNLEIGYRLKKKFWGKGFATEVSLKLIDKATRELGATRIFALAMKENLASIRVMEKVGLKFERSYIEERTPIKNKEAVVYSKNFNK